MPSSACDGGGRRAHLRAEAADQRRRRALEHGDGAAAAAGRGGDLEADEAGADDDDPRRAVGDARPQGERVVERAQLVDDRHGVLAGEAAGRRAGGDDEPVERHDGAVGQRDGAVVEVERRRRHAEAQVEPERVEVVGLAQRDAVRLPVPGEQLLRQRRAVVGQVRLGADQRDRAR